MKMRIVTSAVAAIAIAGGVWASTSLGTDEESYTAPPVHPGLVGEDELVQWMRDHPASTNPDGRTDPMPIIAPAHGDSPAEVIFCPDGAPLTTSGRELKGATEEIEGFDPTDPNAYPPSDDDLSQPTCADGTVPDAYLEMIARGD